tara:strand:- start:698 stop:1237 length:540 start_codon:yes stop_codon:yes gene_type:complete
MRFNASPAIGLKERRLLSLQDAPKVATTDWTKDWMAQHGRESVPKELAAESLGGGGNLNHLGGLTRIKESTVDGVGNVLKGTGRFVFKGQFIKGAAQVGQGALDILDIIPSAAADGVRMVAGPDSPRGGPSPYNYNISRALGSVDQIKKPQHAISAATDIVHASVFKLGSDALRAVQKN